MVRTVHAVTRQLAERIYRAKYADVRPLSGNNAAYIVLKAEVEAGTLERRCRDKLASFKVPRAFLAVDKLPRTALGKVQKHLLPKWEP